MMGNQTGWGWLCALASVVAAAGCAGDESVGAELGYGGACTTDAECDDGMPCTFDACASGSCTHSAIRNCCVTASDCSAPNVCFSSACDSATNRCDFTPLPGCCRDNADCFDGDDCTHDQCNVRTGECMSVPRSCYCRADADCNDGATCTLDRCDPVTSRCTFTPVTGCCTTNADCADADVCTTDVCDVATNTCNAPIPVPGCCNFDDECDDGILCTADVCDATTHTCSASPITGCCTSNAECADGSVCTTDMCDLTTNRCDNTAVAGCCTVDAQCTDGNPCTTNACVGNMCESTPVTGCCLTAGDCADGTACTADSCVANTCMNDPILGCCSDDADCDDGDACTTDTCFLTACTYADACPPDGGVMDGGTSGSDGGTVGGDGSVSTMDGAAGGDGSVSTMDGAAGGDGSVSTMDGAAGGDGSVSTMDGAAGGDGAVGDGSVSTDGAAGDGSVSTDGAIGDGAIGDGAIADGAIEDGAVEDGAAGDGGPSGDGGGVDAGGRDAGPFADAGARHRYTFGGGACSAAGDTRDAPILPIALALLFLVGAAVRRRPRRLRGILVASLISLFALGMLSGVARADGFRLDRHRVPTLPEDMLWTERASVPGDRSPFGRITIDFVDDPLVTRDENGDEHEVLIDHQLGVHLAGGLSLFDHLHMAVALPLFFQSANRVQETDAVTLAAPSDFGVGDLALDLRWVTLDTRYPVELAIAATMTVPIGSSEALAADDTLGFAPRLIVSRALPHDRGYASLALGVSLRGGAELGDLTIGSETFFSAGVLVNIVPKVAATVEIAGSTTFSQAFSAEQTPLEGTLGGRYEIVPGLVSSLGIGTGLTQGYGAPDVRLTAMVGYRAASMAEPTPPPRPPRAQPPGDRDHDGIVDPEDACPDEPEDADGFEDDDGCPDPDNDGDGLLDPDDQCPMQPEDPDGFEDEDGCPDPDNDQDSILDPDDQCPLEAEDRDDFEDENGCPDPDNDGDGILDPNDQCPLEAETVNGVEDEDGCPDLVRVDRETRQIRILEPVYFATNSDRIQRRSFAMLNEIADILNRQTDLGRVSIEGHTDSRGRDRFNLQLSERRAQSVVTYLTSQGVPAERLEAHGFGETHPIASNDTREGRAENRRVEFRLVDMAQRVEVPVAPGEQPEPAPPSSEPVMDE